MRLFHAKLFHTIFLEHFLLYRKKIIKTLHNLTTLFSQNSRYSFAISFNPVDKSANLSFLFICYLGN